MHAMGKVAKVVCLEVAIAVLMLTTVINPPSALAGHVLDFQVLGRGAVVSDCALATPVNCAVVLSGQASGTHIGHDDFSLTLNRGSTSGTLGNGAGGTCVAVRGTGSITPPSAATLISFTLAGIICEEDGAGSPAHFDGTYRITGGSARFSMAVGGGSLTATFRRGAGAAVFMHLHGTISY